MTGAGPLVAALLAWYDREQRDLPWRRTNDPYAIWVSEVMLQQTQVATVIPYYERWMARFPTLAALAAAEPEDALALWQGLGYYRRCRLLRQGARWIQDRSLPTDVAGWRRVPGIGPYTAAAIASIAQGVRAGVVDGNVERVFARLTACDAAGPLRRKLAWEWSERHVPESRPGDFNQALMELGATVCTPKSPNCAACPIAAHCVARQSWTVERYPAPDPRPATARLTRLAWLPYRDGEFGLVQVGESDWWAHLWAFPQADAGMPEAEESLRRITGPGWTESLGSLSHSITHHRISVAASLCRCDTRGHGLRWTPCDRMHDVPLPAPHRKLLQRAMRLLGLAS